MLRKNIGLVLGLITILIHLLAILGFSKAIYTIYNSYFFPLISGSYDNTFGKIEFPMVYIFVFMLISLVLVLILGCHQKSKQFGLVIAFKYAFFKMINFLGLLFFLFYFLWAFNYYRPSLEEQLNFPNLKVDSTILINEIDNITLLLKIERTLIHTTSDGTGEKMVWKVLEDSIRGLQVNLLREWGDHPAGNVRIRPIYPGSLLRISTAGVYLPFVCEGHVDAGLHPIQLPFTMAHEMAHGYGYTDEGVCNFIGLISCLKSTEAKIRYSGLLSYWRYLYSDVKYLYPTLAFDKYNALDKAIREDLESIKKNQAQYPDIFPYLRDFIYDLYLKIHGVDEGLNSYSEIVEQVQRWKKTKYAFNLSR